MDVQEGRQKEMGAGHNSGWLDTPPPPSTGTKPRKGQNDIFLMTLVFYQFSPFSSVIFKLKKNLLLLLLKNFSTLSVSFDLGSIKMLFLIFKYMF